jgi:hypothetical protein
MTILNLGGAKLSAFGGQLSAHHTRPFASDTQAAEPVFWTKGRVNRCFSTSFQGHGKGIQG